MNFTPAPTLIASVVALFRKRAPQPTFTPAMHTQVLVTSNTLTYVDPPIFCSLANAPHAPTGEKRRTCEVPQHSFPETPRAPHRPTFALPVHDWNMADFARHQQYFDDDRASCCKADLDVPDGDEHVCRPAEAGMYAAGEPRALGRMLFLFGFCESVVPSVPHLPFILAHGTCSVPAALDRWLGDHVDATACYAGLGAGKEQQRD